MTLDNLIAELLVLRGRLTDKGDTELGEVEGVSLNSSLDDVEFSMSEDFSHEDEEDAADAEEYHGLSLAALAEIAG